MREKEIKDLFRSDSIGRPEDGKKKASIKILEEAICQKTVCDHVSWWTMAKDQIKYVDKGVLLVQLIFFGIMISSFIMLNQINADRVTYLTIGTMFVLVIGIFAAVGMRRQYAEHFTELGESCYFNIRQMTAIRILIFGTADLIFLLVLTAFVSKSIETGLMDIGVYLCVPFMLAEICYTGLMLTENGRKSIFPAAGMGIVLVSVFVFSSSYPEIYEKSMLFVWYWIFTIAGVILTAEFWFMFYKIEKGEILCTY